MKKIKIIISSTRPGRKGELVAKWVLKETKKYEGNMSFEIIDLKTLELPFMDEPMPPMMGKPYQHGHSKIWSKIVGESDGFIITVPEYNHGYPAPLKNALDFLYNEWVGKPVGIVGYGGSGARDSVRQLREVLAFMKMKPLFTQVGIGAIGAAFNENNEIDNEKIHGNIQELFSELEMHLQK